MAAVRTKTTTIGPTLSPTPSMNVTGVDGRSASVPITRAGSPGTGNRATISATSPASRCCTVSSSRERMASMMIRPTARISSSPKPRDVVAGVPRRMPDAVLGGSGSNGMPFLLTVMPISSSRCSASLPVTPSGVTSTSIRWLSVPPETDPCAFVGECLGKDRGIRGPSAAGPRGMVPRPPA